MTVVGPQTVTELVQSLHLVHPSFSNLGKAIGAAENEAKREEDSGLWVGFVLDQHEKHRAYWKAQGNRYAPKLEDWFEGQMYKQNPSIEPPKSGKRGKATPPAPAHSEASSVVVASPGPVPSVVPEIAVQESLPLRSAAEFFTRDVRAELVSITGRDYSPDDPALDLVLINYLMLPKLGREVAESIKVACAELLGKLTETHLEAIEKVKRMEQEALRDTAIQMKRLATEEKDLLRIDLSQAQAKATTIVTMIDESMKLNRKYWLVIGSIAGALLIGVFFFGFFVGRG